MSIKSTLKEYESMLFRNDVLRNKIKELEKEKTILLHGFPSKCPVMLCHTDCIIKRLRKFDILLRKSKLLNIVSKTKVAGMLTILPEDAIKLTNKILDMVEKI